MPTAKSVAIIVLNWNGRNYLEQCLESLVAQNYPSYSVTVVDNASADDSVAFVRERFSSVNLILNHRNLGYGGGNNAALRETNKPLAAIVNPDVVLPPNWLQKMVDQMQINKDIGIGGCKLLYPNGRIIQHAGGYLLQPQALPGHYGLSEVDSGSYEMIRDVDYVIGAAMVIKREVLERIGLFDEKFFLFFEDADLCFRARNAGYRVAYLPGADAVHAESVTTREDGSAYLRHFHASRWRWLIKHYKPEYLSKHTFEAESNWLERCDLIERTAAGHAYGSTLHNLDEIIATRHSDQFANDVVITDESKSQIRSSLLVLKSQATGGSSLELLQKQWRIQEQEIESPTPFIGPLFARFRRLWNKIEAESYTRQILAQQNTLNERIVRQLNKTYEGTQRQGEELRSVEERFDKVAADITNTNRSLSELKESTTVREDPD